MNPLAPFRTLVWLPVATARTLRPHARRICLVTLLAILGLFAFRQAASWWLVGRLAWRLQHCDDVAAPPLVRELARRGNRAFAVLVDAANSPRAAVALSARREIDTFVDRWQREAYLHPATFDLAHSATPLAEALADTAPHMSPSATRWARSTLEALADLAQSQPLESRLQLLVECDRALASLPSQQQAAALADAGAARMGLALGSTRPPRFSEPAPPAEPQVAMATPLPVETPEPPHQPVAEPNDGVWQHAVDPQTLTEVPHEIDESLTNPLRPRATSPPDSPLAPPPVVAQPSAEIRPIPSPPSEQGPNWFKRLVQGNSAEQQQAAERLAAEGFGRVTRTDALMFLSPSTDDRKAMVDRVMTSPDLEAPAWLKLLLADRAPEVRASALSAIATTGDPQLITQALEVALRDPSPTVADQVPLLRERLR